MHVKALTEEKPLPSQTFPPDFSVFSHGNFREMTTLGTSLLILSVSCKPPEDANRNVLSCLQFLSSPSQSLPAAMGKAWPHFGHEVAEGAFSQFIPCPSHVFPSSPTQESLLSNPGSSFLAFKENPPTCERILLSRAGNLYFVSYRKRENLQPWN